MTPRAEQMSHVVSTSRRQPSRVANSRRRSGNISQVLSQPWSSAFSREIQKGKGGLSVSSMRKS
jgi:hypothetical protein